MDNMETIATCTICKIILRHTGMNILIRHTYTHTTQVHTYNSVAITRITAHFIRVYTEVCDMHNHQ